MQQCAAPPSPARLVRGSLQCQPFPATSLPCEANTGGPTCACPLPTYPLLPPASHVPGAPPSCSSTATSWACTGGPSTLCAASGRCDGAARCARGLWWGCCRETRGGWWVRAAAGACAMAGPGPWQRACVSCHGLPHLNIDNQFTLRVYPQQALSQLFPRSGKTKNAKASLPPHPALPCPAPRLGSLCRSTCSTTRCK